MADNQVPPHCANCGGLLLHGQGEHRGAECIRSLAERLSRAEAKAADQGARIAVLEEESDGFYEEVKKTDAR